LTARRAPCAAVLGAAGVGRSPRVTIRDHIVCGLRGRLARLIVTDVVRSHPTELVFVGPIRYANEIDLTAP